MGATSLARREGVEPRRLDSSPAHPFLIPFLGGAQTSSGHPELGSERLRLPYPPVNQKTLCAPELHTTRVGRYSPAYRACASTDVLACRIPSCKRHEALVGQVPRAGHSVSPYSTLSHRSAVVRRSGPAVTGAEVTKRAPHRRGNGAKEKEVLAGGFAKHCHPVSPDRGRGMVSWACPAMEPKPLHKAKQKHGNGARNKASGGNLC